MSLLTLSFILTLLEHILLFKEKDGFKVLTTFMVFAIFISSPEPKAQVCFSDQNLSVVHHCRKLFTFSSSSPEPLNQFQPNLAQSILG